MKWAWAQIVLAYVLVLVISLVNRTRRIKPRDPEPGSRVVSGSVPKIIYTFWDSQTIPPIVKACIDTWKRHCPDYEIRVMNYENTKHMEIRHRDSHARYSDFVRLHCLSETGGVWIDATVILQRPIDDEFIRGGSYDYSGYVFSQNTTRQEFPVIESWFMVAPKGSRLVADWKHEFFRANEFDSMCDYVDDLLQRGVDKQRIRREWYLAVYIACQYCVQNFGPYENVYTVEAADDAMKYIIDTPFLLRWIPGVCGNNLVKNYETKGYDSCRMIKLVSNDRQSITDEFLEHITKKK
jgi:hypothetical protein